MIVSCHEYDSCLHYWSSCCTSGRFYCLGISCMNELCIYIKRIPTVDSTRCKVWNITIVMQIMIPTPFYYFDISHVMDFSFGVWTDFTVFDLQQQFFILHSLSHVGWLLSSWDTSEGISLHKHNMKEYFQGLVVVRTCSQRSPTPSVDRSYLSWLVEPIHLALNCHKYSSGTVYL